MEYYFVLSLLLVVVLGFIGIVIVKRSLRETKA
jgi:hypothetical protein